jgi:hypothetical protein
MHPVVVTTLGSRLPSFTEEGKKVKGSFDFVGVNRYIAVHVRADSKKISQPFSSIFLSQQINISQKLFSEHGIKRLKQKLRLRG